LGIGGRQEFGRTIAGLADGTEEYEYCQKCGLMMSDRAECQWSLLMMWDE
jgi:hypothetical protein